MTSKSRRRIALLLSGAVLLASTPAAWAQGLYMQEQADRGAGSYAQYCAMCHGSDLEGGDSAPSLKGVDVMGNWGTAWSLYEFFSQAMPPQSPGQLGEPVYVDILAHILAANGAPAGTTALTADQAALQQINLAAVTSAAAAPAPAPAAPAAPAAGAQAAADGPGTLVAPADTPQSFTFGKELPVAPPAAAPAAPAGGAAAPAPAPAAAAAPAAPATLKEPGPTPQAFTFGKTLPGPQAAAPAPAAPTTLAVAGVTPQAFTFGTDLPKSAPAPVAAAPAPAPSPTPVAAAAPAPAAPVALQEPGPTPQAFTAGKVLPAVTK